MARAKHNIRISQSRDIALNLNDSNNEEKIAKIGKALSSKERLEILNILKNTPRSLQEISKIIHVPLSSVAMHIKKLEEAGLIATENQPGSHGSMRVCVCSFTSFSLTTFNADVDSVNKTVSVSMPVGHYFDCAINPPCGLAGEHGAIGAFDTAGTFYLPERVNAQLLWFQSGYIDYKFPNIINSKLKLEELSFSLEICSESAGFLEDWPSEITISINDIEIGSFISPGDFGARRGKLTPANWPNGSSQYGLLYTISLTSSGTYLNKALINNKVNLSYLNVFALPFIKFRIAIKENAKYVGGINIFGSNYGDYPQDIVMTATYE